ncbi:MAG: alpha-E domain-containing protein, partial [Leeuwenhoekiella sp.]
NQIVRIIHSKNRDALSAKGSYGDKFKNSYEWTTLLKCAESYDMMRRFYKKTPTSLTTLEFLILNSRCPRSVMNSLNQVGSHIKVLNSQEYPSKNSAAFLIGRVRAEYKYKLIEEIDGSIENFIEHILDTVVLIAKKIEKEYFNY